MLTGLSIGLVHVDGFGFAQQGEVWVEVFGEGIWLSKHQWDRLPGLAGRWKLCRLRASASGPRGASPARLA